MASLSVTITQGCQNGGGVLTVTQVSPAPGASDNLQYTWVVLASDGQDYGGQFDSGAYPVAVGLPNGEVTARVRGFDPETNSSYSSQGFSFVIDCGADVPGGLVLDFASATDETAAGNDGTATIQASGGVAPLTALLLNLTQTQPALSGQPNTFPGLPGGQYYTLRVFDSTKPVQQYVEAAVYVGEHKEPRDGCQDEYADNYDPLATSGGMDSCSYSTRWRSAWQPMAVVVAALPGQTAAYTVAELRIGFRPGHPLAALRPLGESLRLRATVGPDGYATFRLGPHLQAALGVEDGHGGYRLDLNTQTADDAYVGYELRRLTGELLEAGYALNAAVPEAQLFDGAILSSFGRVPVWPGHSWKHYQLASRSAGRYGAMDETYGDTVWLPCPSNPLPVAWLNPLGGWDFWVFQGRTQFGDTVGEGQQYREAVSGEQRYSDPGDSYQTFKASSGTFGGDDLLRGLRTLWRSPQAWAILEPEGEWVPIVIERGSRDVGRLGVRRQEVVLNFTTASPEWAQGQ
jgi:hypothetical protein